MMNEKSSKSLMLSEKRAKLIDFSILVGPGALLYLAIMIFPIFYCIGLSFFQWSRSTIEFNFVGLENYFKILIDPVFHHGLRNNVLIVVVSIFGQIPLGFVLAYIIHRKMVKGTNIFEPMIFLPITISPVVIAVLFDNLFSPNGVITNLARMITGEPRFIFKIFQQHDGAMIPILIVILWMYTGIYMVIFIANLQKISPSVIEAAIIDGATELQILWHVILPSMIGVIFTTAVFAISGSLKSFDLIFAMTGGGPAHYTEVIAIYMYQHTFRYNKYGYGSAVSVIIIAISMGFIRILQAVVDRIENNIVKGKRRRA